MTNMMDYLLWRGDLPLAVAPFGAIDAMILARAAYLPLEQVMKPLDNLTFSQAESALTAHTSAFARPQDAELLHALAQSQRFGGCTICHCHSILDRDTQTQFAAITIRLHPNVLFLAYRGTDDSVIGWKEDFNMSFAFPVPSQKLALTYAKQVAEDYAGETLILGGHSKGGNLAVYAASFCGETLQSRISEVYNFDGPGFDRRVMQTPSYLSLSERIHTYVPQSSIIGQLLEHEEPYTIVHSEESGFTQHDLYTWALHGREFVLDERISLQGVFADTTLRSWIESMDDAQRERFFDAVYQLAVDSNIQSVSFIREHWVESSRQVFKTVRKMDEQSRKNITFALKLLFRSAKQAMVVIRGNGAEEVSDGKQSLEN